jgi:hypothetical protein
MLIPSPPFRFDRDEHTYYDLDGTPMPHITGMLQQTGWIDSRWYTEEASARGTAVHKVTADYDLGALDVPSCISRFRPYLLAHIKVMGILKPTVLEVETPRVHPRLRFGGRPDRAWMLFGLGAVGEIKSGEPEKSHQVQTALQAILLGPAFNMPPEILARVVVYLKPTGKFKVEEHKDRRDFDEAYRVLRECAA